MKLGLLGTGAVGRLHANAAADLSGVEVAAVCSLSADEAAAVAGPHRAAVFTDHRTMLDHGIDAVVVSTPHALHQDMVSDAVDAGVHVLVEKPMATSVAGCDAMVSACKSAGVALAVGHIQHFMPDQVAAQQAIQDGQIGRPLLVHEYRTADYRPRTRPEWFFDPQMAGGGAVMNIGSHSIDRSSWLVDALPATVDSAFTWSRFGVGVETDAIAHLSTTNGVRVSLTVTSTSPVQVNEVTIVGEEGTVVAAPSRGTVLRAGDSKKTLHEPAPGDIPTAFRNQLAAFADLINNGTTFPVSTDLSRGVVATVLGIYEASRTEQPVSIDTCVEPLRA